MKKDFKYCKESRVMRTSRVFPNDVNNHNTLFGGRLMSENDPWDYRLEMMENAYM